MSDHEPHMASTDSLPLPSEPDSGVELPADGEQAEGGDGTTDMSPEEAAKDAEKNPYKRMEGCQKCCGGVMNLFANDAIYGSFVGPHPVSFVCMCRPFRKCIKPGSMQYLCIASIATKVMNFIMLCVVALVGCFFIIPYRDDDTFSTTWGAISSFYPCTFHDKRINAIRPINNHEKNGGCWAHAGYFMAYRCFIAFACVMLTNFFAMLNVTSTNDDPYRKRIHHGFWLYKYVYLFVLLLVFFVIVNADSDPYGVFEYTCSILGNIAHSIFTLIEFTYILDIVDILVISIMTSGNSWSNFLYLVITTSVLIVDISAFIAIFSNFSHKLEFPILKLRQLAANEYSSVNSSKVTLPESWPYTNCLEGKWKEPEWSHIGLMIGILILVSVLVVVMAFKLRLSKKYPFQGWLQVSVIILFNMFYLWSALFNSSKVHSRPRCNWAFEWARSTNFKEDHAYGSQGEFQPGSQDTYFRYTGFVHGMIAVFSLIYYAFVHGPRSRNSPMSLAYRIFVYGDYDREPVIPDLDTATPEFKDALEKLEVWDDEQDKVAQSWSRFYLMMLIGSLSLMMSMTNFTDPWAEARYNSSDVAMYFKYFTVMGVTLAYIFLLVCPCTRVDKDYEAPRIIRRVYRKRVQADTPEEKMEEAGVIIEIIEEDEVSLPEDPVEAPKTNQCGCLF